MVAVRRVFQEVGKVIGGTAGALLVEEYFPLGGSPVRYFIMVVVGLLIYFGDKWAPLLLSRGKSLLSHWKQTYPKMWITIALLLIATGVGMLLFRASPLEKAPDKESHLFIDYDVVRDALIEPHGDRDTQINFFVRVKNTSTYKPLEKVQVLIENIEVVGAKDPRDGDLNRFDDVPLMLKEDMGMRSTLPSVTFYLFPESEKSVGILGGVQGVADMLIHHAAGYVLYEYRAGPVATDRIRRTEISGKLFSRQYKLTISAKASDGSRDRRSFAVRRTEQDIEFKPVSTRDMSSTETR